MEQKIDEQTPIARFESQRNKRKVYEDNFLFVEWRYDPQRTLAIRIAAMILTSDRSMTTAQLCPSKVSARERERERGALADCVNAQTPPPPPKNCLDWTQDIFS